MSGSTTGHSRSHIVTLLDVRDVNVSVLYHTGTSLLSPCVAACRCCELRDVLSVNLQDT